MPKKASQGWSDDATQSCSGDLHSEGMKKKEGPACILHEMCNGQGWSKAIERETCNDHCMQDGCNVKNAGVHPFGTHSPETLVRDKPGQEKE